MNYKPLKAGLGDILNINEHLSLRYEKFADDILPVWHEIPPESGNVVPHEGDFVSVTEDVWFVYENGRWRVMDQKEHVEANRQAFISKTSVKNEDCFSRP